MQEQKKYYWIKLKTNFFSKDEIDFLLSQKNGCEYIVLYQMLCLLTANNNGEMTTKIGEMIVPYNVEKIVRDTKYFDTDTVVVAIELFRKLGLIYQEEDGALKISNFDEMVGSETQWAEKKRKLREKQKNKQLELKKGDNVPDNVLEEYRDKSLDIRDKNIYIEENDKEENLCEFVEQNYGRTLSYMEYEKINKWRETFTDDIIKYAFELSITNNVKKTSYVESILKNWKASQYKTIDEIKQNDKHKKADVPKWMDKDIKQEEVTDEELKELEKEFEEFK